MKKTKLGIRYLFFMTAMIAAFTVSALAQIDKTVDVRFKRGATSATVSGTRPIYFNVRARKGQTIGITSTPGNIPIELYTNFEPLEPGRGVLVWKVLETWDYQIRAIPRNGRGYKLLISIK